MSLHSRLMANRPSEGSRATRQALDDPSRENIRHYLRAHIHAESLVRDELVETSPFIRYRAPDLAVLLFKSD